MIVNTDFALNKKEQYVLNVLRETALFKAPKTKVRIAGGWVRDKLLGLESDDIDVAIDNMSGTEFAKLVHEYLKETGVKRLPKVTTIEANTDANKHLESALLKIGGIEVDFAQLRREFYSDDSRNPLIEVGVTASEDAKRRDLTINAIFYNVMTGKIEDYVGGIQDLECAVAKTPQDPIKTYKEDPLRILRAVRFAARFNLTLDAGLIRAARDPFVQMALEHKISRERIWVEFSKFMVGPNFHYAARLLELTGLRNILLTLTDNQMERACSNSDNTKWMYDFGNWDMDQDNPYHSLNVWDHTMSALEYLHDNIDHRGMLAAFHHVGDTDMLVRNIALLLHDIGKCDMCSQQVHLKKGYSTYYEHEESSAHAANVILKDMRAPNEIRERVVKLIANHMRLHHLPLDAKSGLRRVVRDIGAKDWKIFVEMSKSDSMGKNVDKLSTRYDLLDKLAKEYMDSLNGESKVKPPINGKDVMQILSLQPGPNVGVVMDALNEKLLEYPDMNKEEATAFIKDISL